MSLRRARAVVATGARFLVGDAEPAELVEGMPGVDTRPIGIGIATDRGEPRVAALGVLHQLRRLVLVLLGQPVLPDVGRLEDVAVGVDDRGSGPSALDSRLIGDVQGKPDADVRDSRARAGGRTRATQLLDGLRVVDLARRARGDRRPGARRPRRRRRARRAARRSSAARLEPHRWSAWAAGKRSGRGRAVPTTPRSTRCSPRPTS